MTRCDFVQCFLSLSPVWRKIAQPFTAGTIVIASTLQPRHKGTIRRETRRQGDKETRRQGDKETGRGGTGRQGDKETGRQGDKETGRQGDWQTRRQGDWRRGSLDRTSLIVILKSYIDPESGSHQWCFGEPGNLFYRSDPLLLISTS